jgi:TolB-like protein/tetratricopeptide (TPR) repeat protein
VEIIHLPPRELSALRLLLGNAGRIVSPAQLKRALWGEVHVTAESVPRCISSLRARLGPDDYIQTVYKRGYRLQIPVKRDADSRGAELPRLAILPFECGHNVAAHLGPVVADDTAARLTAIQPPKVTVIARDSVFSLARKGLTAREVGEALGADLAVTGTLHALPTHFRLRVEMLRVEDGAQIWVEDMLVGLDRLSTLKTDLVQRLTFRLGGGYSIAATEEGTPQPDAQAYETFLRGRFELQSLERHSMQDGTNHLRRAVEMEPKLVEARVDLVNACLLQESFGFMSPAVAADQARRIAATIPEEGGHAEAILPALGWIAFHVDRDLAAGLELLSRGAHLPFDQWRARWTMMFTMCRHRFSEAIAMLEEWVRLDPYSPWANGVLSWAYFLARRHEESVRQVERCLKQNPEHTGTRMFAGIILAHNGEARRASAITREFAREKPNFDLAMSVHAYSLARAGETDEAHDLLEQLQWLSRERFVMRSITAGAYAALGEKESALEELRAADVDRCPWFFQALADPRLDPVRSDPGFERLISKLEDLEQTAAAEEFDAEGPD